MRKPGPFMIDGWYYVEVMDDGAVYFHSEAFRHDIVATKEIERLAAWLLKAAAWIREQEAKR